MALPPLATVTDLAALLNQTITATADVARADQLLLGASSMVRAISGSPWVDTDGDLLWASTTDANLQLVEETLVSVTLAAAGRAYTNPDGAIARSETLGAYSESLRWANDVAGGIYLTDDEEKAIARVVALYRGSGSPGLWTLSTTRGDVETDTVFLDTVYSGDPLLVGEPMPYRALGDPS